MKKNKILIVDDIAQNIAILDNLLNQTYDIIVSTTGQRALELVKNESPDLILLDVVMPEMSGFEVCQNLKSDVLTQNIPIIFLTAKSDDESIIEGFNLGAVDYITKPFRPAELLVRINTHLSLLNYQRFLEEKVEMEINLRKEQEQVLVQNSKMAEMGEMINNIAHQWRQPVNRVSLLLSNVQLSLEDDPIDAQYINQKVQSSLNQLEFISETIDDFSNFFSPVKAKESFDVSLAIDKTIKIIRGTFSSFGIVVDVLDENDFPVYGTQNELAQVALIILSNAKDALVKQHVESPKIFISIDSSKRTISFKDNGGGINDEIIHDIFDHYFTTKEAGEGTGIGLYTAKIIMQKTFQGKISAQNEDDGAVLTLHFI